MGFVDERNVYELTAISNILVGWCSWSCDTSFSENLYSLVENEFNLYEPAVRLVSLLWSAVTDSAPVIFFQIAARHLVRNRHSTVEIDQFVLTQSLFAEEWTTFISHNRRHRKRKLWWHIGYWPVLRISLIHAEQCSISYTRANHFYIGQLSNFTSLNNGAIYGCGVLKNLLSTQRERCIAFLKLYFHHCSCSCWQSH
jgi:hypothetical protein